jgi:putative hemolysin
MDDTVAGILSLLCLVLSAFFASVETAFLSLSHLRLKKLESEGDTRAALILRILSDKQRVLITCLIGSTITVVAAITLLFGLIHNIMNGDIEPIWYAWAGSKQVAGALYSIVSMTFLVLVIGEIIPRTVAIYGGYTYARFVSRFFYIIMYLSYPVTGLMVWLIKKLVPKYSDWNAHLGATSSTDEIDRYFDLGEEVGIIEKEEKEMISSVFEFRDTIAREVMVPKPDIIALPINTGFDELLEFIAEDGHSRFPVYDGSLDKIVGILYVKDVLIKLKELRNHFDLFKLLRQTFFIPETKKLDDLLGEFQKRKQHLSIVVDEYGCVSGLVTIEDLLEEIVGEIVDEYDLEEQEQIIKLDDHNFSVDAKYSMEDLEEDLACKFEYEDAETVGGYILEKLGRIPSRGEKLEVPQGIFHITEIRGNRIMRVKLTLAAPQTDGSEA